MSSYADSSFLVSLYTPDVNSTEAQAWAGRQAPLWLSPFGEFEFTNAIDLRVFRGQITAEQAAASLRAFGGDIGSFFVRHPMPTAAFERALLLARRHTRQSGVRSLDILHVAIALELGAEVFLTFDRGQKKLAHAAGLKAKP